MNQSNPDRSTPSKIPLVIAHRGASLAAPENTMRAFSLALAAGADIIETDAQLTADDQVVLVHDAELRRTTGHDGDIRALPAREVSGLNAAFAFQPSSGTHVSFHEPDVQIPTFDELLTALLDRDDVWLNLEIKSQGDAERTSALVIRAVAILQNYGMIDRSLISSFDRPALMETRTIEPRLATGLLVGRNGRLDEALTHAAESGHVAVHPAAELIGGGPEAQRSISAAHELKLSVNVWTVDDTEQMRSLIDAGVDGIITNDPARLREVIDRSLLRDRNAGRSH